MENDVKQEMWATIELMGHAQTAGRISYPSELGGLIRIDVPEGENGNYRSEFYGMSAIYSIKFVSEKIARAFVQPVHGVIAYDTPIVTREQYEAEVKKLEMRNRQLKHQVDELQRRLISIEQLPAEEYSEEIEF